MGKRFDPRHIAKLESSERREKFPPEEIISIMDVQPKSVIADLGAGSGYFTLPLAKISHKVYAVDIEAKMLAYLQEKLEEHQVKNVELIEASLENTTLADEEVDLILCSLVMHEVDSISQVLQEMIRILKPAGKAYIIDWEKKPTESGPPIEKRISSNELTSIVEDLQVKIDRRQDLADYYLIVVEK